LASGCERNGQALTAKVAHVQCDGGSELIRFTAHIGPMTKAFVPGRAPPQIQHCRFR
jgi:hypothetical protein